MIISLVLILSSLNHVSEKNGNEAYINIPNLEQISGLISSIPGPIADFINSFQPADLADNAQQIGADFEEAASDFTSAIDQDTPSRIWEEIDKWFLDLTGLRLADVFRGIGQTIVWFLELALALFKWLLSLFEAP